MTRSRGVFTVTMAVYFAIALRSEAQRPSRVDVELLPSPDAVGYDVHGGYAADVRIELCRDDEMTCSLVAVVRAGSRLVTYVLSPAGDRVALWTKRPGRRGAWQDRLKIVDVTHEAEAHVCEIEAIDRPASSASIIWVSHDNVLMRWTTGSDIALATLCDPRGRVLLTIDAHSVSISTELRFMASYPALGAPRSEARKVQIFDLGTGELLHTINVGDSSRGIRSLVWRPDAFEFVSESYAGRVVRHVRPL
jgi:hypothetical protein